MTHIYQNFKTQTDYYNIDNLKIYSDFKPLLSYFLAEFMRFCRYKEPKKI